jgi:hypothetical protein
MMPPGDRPDYNAERVTNADRQFNADQLFSLKEWMAAISSKLDRMEVMLAGKAEVTHVREVEVRVGKLELQQVTADAEMRYFVPQHAGLLQDVGSLKTQAASTTSVSSYRRWLFSVAAFQIISVGVAIAALVRP